MCTVCYQEAELQGKFANLEAENYMLRKEIAELKTVVNALAEAEACRDALEHCKAEKKRNS